MNAPPLSPLYLFADRTPALSALSTAVECPAAEAGKIPAHLSDWDDLRVHLQGAATPTVDIVSARLRPDGRPAAEALAEALLLMEILRDAKQDWTEHHTLFLPLSWFHDAALSPERLGSASACGQTRAVLDRGLDGVDHLLVDAASLPDAAADPEHRRNLALILCLAARMARRLRHRDPLNRTVRLGWRCRLRCRLSVRFR